MHSDPRYLKSNKTLYFGSLFTSKTTKIEHKLICENNFRDMIFGIFLYHFSTTVFLKVAYVALCNVLRQSFPNKFGWKSNSCVIIKKDWGDKFVAFLHVSYSPKWTLFWFYGTFSSCEKKGSSSMTKNSNFHTFYLLLLFCTKRLFELDLTLVKFHSKEWLRASI